MRDDIARAMSKDTIELVDARTCAWAFGMGKEQQGAPMGIELDILELWKSLLSTRLWASGVLVFDQI